MAMITEVGDYFAKGCGRCARFETEACSTRIWADGLEALRAICLEAGLEETVKWGHPCYMFAGRNVAIIGALRGEYRLTFFHAGLLTDPDGVLEQNGPNTQNPGVMKFTSGGAVADREGVIRAYLAEAIGYAEAGVLPPKSNVMPDMPEELSEALDTDPELAEAFHTLTPGRQKSYLLNLNAAKQSQTRVTRIAKFRDKIMAGKGALER